MAIIGSSAPSQNTINYDALLSTSMTNYSKTFADNVSKSNAIFYEFQRRGMYKGKDGGERMSVPIMYGLGGADWYDGYDTLSTEPTDGLTTAFFEWRQMSAPITISRKEERQNSSSTRIADLLGTKITQAELGMKETFAKAMLQGNVSTGGASLATPVVSTRTGASGIDPLPLLVNAVPGAAGLIGNIDPSTNPFWQNQVTVSGLSGASKPTSFLQEADHLFNSCGKGPGGSPKLIVTDQVTFELWNAAYYDKYRKTADTDADYPFENIKFRNAIITWDEFVPDVANGTTTPNSGTGTAYFINPLFMGITYDTETNFISTPFVKPADQDAKVAQILWMGNMWISNRRKQGVWTNIPRTLTFA